MNEAFKNQLLSSHEFYQAKRWEGKPWRYKVRYLYANYPEVALGIFVFTFIAPAICLYKTYTFKDSRREAIRKYRAAYAVVRDDHPNIENIMKEKEAGREFFPKY